MRVLLSLPVHECRRVIEDQLRNLSFFFEDPIILLHLSAGYTENPDFSEFPNVIINPRRLKTRWGNIAYLHYENLRYARRKRLAFDYVVFVSSNELYFRPGVERLLAKAPAFFDPRGYIRKEGSFAYAPQRNVFYMHTSLTTPAITNDKLLAFVRRNRLPGIIKSQIEGSAYRKDIAMDILRVLDKEFGFPYVEKAQYCAEEILLPTIACAIVRRRHLRWRRPFSFNDWCHDFTPRLLRKAILYWRGEQKSRRLERYFSSIDAANDIYAIKGVRRIYYDSTRRFIRRFTGGYPLSFSTMQSYWRADTGYVLRTWKTDLRPRRATFLLGQWVLGWLSRCIGHPKGYLKHHLRGTVLSLLKRAGIRL